MHYPKAVIGRTPSICLPILNGHTTPVVFLFPASTPNAMIASFPPPLRLRSSFLCTDSFLHRHGSRLDRGTTSKTSVCLPAAAAVAPFIKDGALRINGREALTGVPENVVATYPLADAPATFLGAVSDRKDSRHVFKLGVLRLKKKRGFSFDFYDFLFVSWSSAFKCSCKFTE